MIRHYAWLWLVSTILVAGGITATAVQAEPRRAAQRKSVNKDREVNTQYRQAMVLFRAGKFREASQAFAKILKTAPGHEPSRLHLAKTYFRLDLMEESYEVFRGLNPRGFDPETSYEYGRTFFDHGQYDEALKAFNQVPNGHGLYDLACYYGAIAALKLKRFREAAKLIDNAVVLPSKLAKSRNLYKQHIQQLAAREEEEELLRQKAAEERRLREQTRVFREQLNQNKENNVPAAPSEEPASNEHKGFYQVPKMARAGFVKKQQFVDYANIKTYETKIHTNFFEFARGISTAQTQRSPRAYGIDVGFSILDRNYDVGFEQAVDPDLNKLILHRSFEGGERGNQKIATGELNVWLERSAGKDWWVGGKLGMFQVYPDFKSGQSLANRRLEVLFGKKRPTYNIGIKVRGIDTVNHKSKRLILTKEEELFGEWKLPQDMGFETNLRAQQFQYDNTFLEGPRQTVRFGAGLFADFPLGVRLGIQGRIQQNKTYKIITLPQYTFDQEDTSGRAYIRFAPVKWFAAELEGIREQRRFLKVSPEGAENFVILNQQRHNFVSDSTLTVMVNLAF